MNFTEQGKQALQWLSEGKEVEFRSINQSNIFIPVSLCSEISLFSSNQWEFRIAKPKLKLVDMSKLPKGAMTNLGELLGYAEGLAQCAHFDRDKVLYATAIHPAHLRIAEQTEFTCWGGDKCPVPNGLMVQTVLRAAGAVKTKSNALDLRWQHKQSPDDILAYRIVCLADGWSDDPSQAS
jgi:hypothetical protein